VRAARPSRTGAGRSRLKRLVGNPALARFTGGAFVSSVGTGLFTAAAVIFFVSRVGLSASRVGLALSLGAVLGLLVADRTGVRGTLIAVLCVRAIAFGGLGAAGDIVSFTFLVTIGVAGDQATPGLQQALVGSVTGAEQRQAAMAALRAVRNVGLSLGVLAGGAAVQFGSDAVVRGTLLGNGLSFLVLAAAVRALPVSRTRPEGSVRRRAPTRSAFRNPRFLVLTVANGIVLLHDSVLFVLLPIWLVQRTGLPPGLVSLLMLANTVGTVALQLWLPRQRIARSWPTGYVGAAVTLAGGCLCFAAAEHLVGAPAVGAILLAVVLVTLAENVHAVAAWDLSYRVASEGRSAEYLGVFQLSSGVNSVVGPILVTAVVLPAAAAGWAVLAVLVAVGSASTVAVGRPVVRADEPPAEVGTGRDRAPRPSRRQWRVGCGDAASPRNRERPHQCGVPPVVAEPAPGARGERARPRRRPPRSRRGVVSRCSPRSPLRSLHGGRLLWRARSGPGGRDRRGPRVGLALLGHRRRRPRQAADAGHPRRRGPGRHLLCGSGQPR
jgi:predicted MFS family arabinose efflux permease